MGASKLKIPKICPQCGKPFEAKTVVTVYCSHYCVDRASKERRKHTHKKTQQQAMIEATKERTQERPYITVAEAVILFSISKNTMHRLIKSGKIPAVNLGERLTRVSKEHIEAMFTPVPIPEEKKLAQEQKTKPEPKPEPTKFQYDLRECYTIIEAAKKYNVAPSSMGRIIRRSNLPQKKINNCVYTPKELIDNIFNPQNNINQNQIL